MLTYGEGLTGYFTDYPMRQFDDSILTLAQPVSNASPEVTLTASSVSPVDYGNVITFYLSGRNEFSSFTAFVQVALGPCAIMTLPPIIAI